MSFFPFTWRNARNRKPPTRLSFAVNISGNALFAFQVNYVDPNEQIFTEQTKPSAREISRRVNFTIIL